VPYCHIVKNKLLQTAFSAILLNGISGGIHCATREFRPGISIVEVESTTLTLSSRKVAHIDYPSYAIFCFRNLWMGDGYGSENYRQTSIVL